MNTFHKCISVLDKVPILKKIFFETTYSENEDHGIWSHHFMGNRWGNSGNSVSLFLGISVSGGYLQFTTVPKIQMNISS